MKDLTLTVVRLEGGNLVMIDPTTGAPYAFGPALPDVLTTAHGAVQRLRELATEIEERAKEIRRKHAELVGGA